LCAVPLHKAKFKIRGFNQSADIASGIEKITAIKQNNSLLIRQKNSPSQTKLNREEREVNVKNAFFCPEDLTDKTILLIDDIITTGSTMNECAKALKRAGAWQVDLAAIGTPV